MLLKNLHSKVDDLKDLLTEMGHSTTDQKEGQQERENDATDKDEGIAGGHSNARGKKEEGQSHMGDVGERHGVGKAVAQIAKIDEAQCDGPRGHQPTRHPIEPDNTQSDDNDIQKEIGAPGTAALEHQTQIHKMFKS